MDESVGEASFGDHPLPVPKLEKTTDRACWVSDGYRADGNFAGGGREEDPQAG
jgi:hypothetical protein